jgi:hypothetical protein
MARRPIILHAVPADGKPTLEPGMASALALVINPSPVRRIG